MMTTSKLKVLSLCDGISGGFMALRKLGIDFDYHAVEIDKHAVKISEDNFWPDIVRWQSDVNLITIEDIEKNGPYDLVMFGSPCQSVSVSGKGEGLDGKSGLLIQCVQVLNWVLQFNPNAKFLIENVKMKHQFLKQFNEVIGNIPTLINSSLVSGQKRERYYWSNFRVTTPQNKKITAYEILDRSLGKEAYSLPNNMKDLLESRICWDKGIEDYLTPMNLETYIRHFNSEVIFAYSSSQRDEGIIERRSNVSGKSNTLTTGSGCSGGPKSTSYVAKIFDGEILVRNFTPRECARLQTIPDDFSFDRTSNSQSYKAIGNGWTVDVIEHILKCGFNKIEIYPDLL